MNKCFFFYVLNYFLNLKIVIEEFAIETTQCCNLTCGLNGQEYQANKSAILMANFACCVAIHLNLQRQFEL